MDLSKKFAAEMRAEMKAAEQKLRNENPEYRGLKLKSEVFAYRKRPRGWSGHQERVVSGMLTNKQFLNSTNAAIVEQVADWYPDYQPSTSIMYRPLYASSIAKISRLFREHGLEIVVRPSDTLSKLKRAIQAGKRDEMENALQGQITIMANYVIVNSKTFSIHKARKNPSIRIALGDRRPYVRVDYLTALLHPEG